MLQQDLRSAFRALIKRPGFSLVAVGTLALGIGANTAIFSVVNAVLLRPLPYPDAVRIAWVRGSSVNTRQPGNLSPLDFLDLQERTRRFELLAAYNNYADATLTGAGELGTCGRDARDQRLLRGLGRQAAGRHDFRAEDDVPGASPVAILGFGFWQRRFAGDLSIVGRTRPSEWRPNRSDRRLASGISPSVS